MNNFDHHVSTAIVRPIQKADLGSIADIYNQAIEDGQKTADTIRVSVDDRIIWYEDLLKSDSPAFVAEVDDRVVGYIYSTPYRYGRPAVSKTVEVSFYVDRNYFRRGIATLLLNTIISYCSDVSIHNLVAILIETNEASKGILQKFGFIEWGRLPGVVEFGDLRLDHLYYGMKIIKMDEK